MSAATLLAKLTMAGIHAVREGEILRVWGDPGVRAGLLRERIAEHKPALLAEMTPLDAEIITSGASRRSHDEIAHRVARITGRHGHPPSVAW